ncbi:hypothetical protein BLOT_013023 [Blomia tropicalis]|nr:hypothetical protein BLOT_013023 [Blomia tropicalis]
MVGLNGSITNVLNGSTDRVLIPSLCFAIGSIMAMFFAIEKSGAHANSAFTVGFAVAGTFKWIRVPFYLIAQHIGSFIGTALIYSIHHSSINQYENEWNQRMNCTGPNELITQMFITGPSSQYSTLVPLVVDQIISEIILTFGMLYVSKNINYPNIHSIQIIWMGMLLFVIGFAFNGTAIINPARDLGPRLFLSLIGYGKFVFSAMNGQFWWIIGIGAPHLGACLGGFLYRHLNLISSKI